MCPRLEKWPRRKPRNGPVLLLASEGAACTALGEKGGFGYEATVSPGRPPDGRAGRVHLGSALGSASRGAGGLGQPLFSASGCLS